MKRKDDTLYPRIIEFINTYINHRGYSPSTREISEGIQCSRPTVQRYLNDLREQGRIDYKGHRGIVLNDLQKTSEPFIKIPLLGKIPCGGFNEAIVDTGEFFPLPYSLVGDEAYFFLRASGDSMINAGISDGDLVLIKAICDPEEGQIVACLLDNNETTLKRLYIDNNTIILHPENKEIDDIILKGRDRERISIQGVATMVIKRL